MLREREKTPIFGFTDEDWWNWSKAVFEEKTPFSSSRTKADETDRRMASHMKAADEGCWMTKAND